ncbi:ABC transporter substrate-binding protein [Streptomyces tsukubensis]|uniref:ABC transporter substrate-binding protein n=1 Tax=Streptomyces tsukubensis TaxID=83656 RepID=UPI0026AA0ABB
MHRRKTAAGALVAAMGLTMSLSGCGTSGESEEVTLRLVAADYGDGAKNSSQKYWDEVVSAFQKDHPDIKVDVDVESWKNVDGKVAKMVKDDDAPDMAQIGAYADYAVHKKLYSADDVLSIPVQADFLPSLTAAGEVNRIQYGMPFAASTRLLFYNKTLFKNAGLTPPTTWKELQEDAQALKNRGVKYPFALPLGREEAQAETFMWMLSGGSGLTDNIDSYTLDSPQNQSTFTWLRDQLVGKGLTGPVAPGELDRADAFSAFTRGEVGMLNGHPTLMGAAQAAGVDYGMVPMPGKDGKAKSTMGVTDWMMAFKQHGHRKQISQFLDFVYSEKNVTKFSDEYNLLPVTDSASHAMSVDSKHTDLREFLRELPNSQLYPAGKLSWAQVSASLKQEIGSAVKPGGNPESVLTHIQREAAAEENAE